MRLHVAQIHYNPAYYDAPIDYLEEPTAGSTVIPALGRLRQLNEVNGLLIELKGSTVSHLSDKLLAITMCAAAQMADLLVFPEYSVPLGAVQKLRELAVEHRLNIVAGSHRVAAGPESQATYAALGITSTAILGTAICPILLATGDVRFVLKASRSKWEPSLHLGSPNHAILELPGRDGSIRVGVLLCIEALSPEVLGALWTDRSSQPSLVICPSLSPTTNVFSSVAELVSLNEAAFLYANSASFGGTVFYVPEKWRGSIESSAGTFAPLPAGVEGVVQVDVRTDRFFLKKGSVLADPLARRPINIPLVYGAEQASLAQIPALQDFIMEALATGDVSVALDYLDTYLSEPDKHLPELMMRNLQQLRHVSLPLYSGDISLIEEAFAVFTIPVSCAATVSIWSNHVKRALDTLLDVVLRADITSVAEDIWYSIKTLKGLQQMLPAPDPQMRDATSAQAPSELGFKGAINLVEAFQNRGTDFERLRDFTQSSESRVLFVTGGRGIGKTDFLNAIFLKNLRDWDVIRVPVARGSRVVRIIADVAFQLGMIVDIDSLAAASANVFQQKVRKLFSMFYTHPKRALIIDDLGDVFEEATGRDFRHFEAFLNEARSPQYFVGGRVIFVTSSWLKREWINSKGVWHLPLKELHDIYIRRIVEFQLRTKGAVSGEAAPHIPQSLVDLVRGHPLSARLLVDAAADSPLTDLASDLAGITQHIATELLKHVKLSAVQRDALSALSIFRLAVRADLVGINKFGFTQELLLQLARSSVVIHDGSLFGMHEAIRRFFYNKLHGPARNELHSRAVAYYELQRMEEEKRGTKNPSTAAELVYHAVMSGDARLAARLKTLVVEELKPTARRIYREEHDYDRALEIYKAIAEIVPDDTEVLAYLGRCYARVRSWDESDIWFGRAARMAGRRGEAWWVLRDWGHIRARYGFFEEAKQCFIAAEKKKGSPEASISAAFAYMYWRQNDIGNARHFFEEALDLNPDHGYALAYYAKLLDEVGEHSRAHDIREHLLSLEGTLFREENEIEMDTEDL